MQRSLLLIAMTFAALVLGGFFVRLVVAQEEEPLPAPVLTGVDYLINRADLSWTAVPGAVRYELEVGTLEGVADWSTDPPAPLIWTVSDSLTETSYSHTGLTGYAIYGYKVRAIDASGRPGKWSNYTRTKVNGVAEILPPKLILAATPNIVERSVTLNWQDIPDVEFQIHVYYLILQPYFR